MDAQSGVVVIVSALLLRMFAAFVELLFAVITIKHMGTSSIATPTIP
jgi:hypothetical protein